MRHRQWLIVIGAFAIAFGAACTAAMQDPAIGPEGSLLVQVEPAVMTYDLGPGAMGVAIPVTIRNEGADTLYLEPCGLQTPLYVIRYSDAEGDWQRVDWDHGACPAIGQPPVVLAPGESRADTTSIGTSFGN